MAPALASKASVSVVFPAAPCPTKATLRMASMLYFGMSLLPLVLFGSARPHGSQGSSYTPYASGDALQAAAHPGWAVWKHVNSNFRWALALDWHRSHGHGHPLVVREFARIYV